MLHWFLHIVCAQFCDRTLLLLSALELLQFVFIIQNEYMCNSNIAILFVHLSITRWYCVKTAKPNDDIFTFW